MYGFSGGTRFYIHPACMIVIKVKPEDIPLTDTFPYPIPSRSENRENKGSSTNEVRGDICAFNVLALIDDVSAATKPERLAHISLGQENPRMRMNAAPG